MTAEQKTQYSTEQLKNMTIKNTQIENHKAKSKQK